MSTPLVHIDAGTFQKQLVQLAETVTQKVKREAPVAVIHAPLPLRRTISEGIALLPEDSTAIMDADFANDVEAAIENHREPLEPPAWD